MYLNKVFVFGNLTRDPEMKALPSGVNVTSFGLATNRFYKDKDGTRKDQTEFHNIVLFGKQAELAAQYLKKGSSVLIEGRIQTRSWDSEGTKKYRTEIIAEAMQFGPRPGAGGASAGSYSDSGAKSKGSKSKTDSDAVTSTGASTPIDTIQYPDEEINVDDIPF